MVMINAEINELKKIQSVSIWRSQISVLMAPLRVAIKTAFATVKSTIYTSNSSNTVLLFLNSKNKNKVLYIYSWELKNVPS